MPLKTIKCLECENVIEIPEDYEVGDFLECDYCGVEMEIKNKNPYKLKLIGE